MNRCIRTTLVYGAISGFFVMPAATWLATVTGGAVAFRLTLWVDLLLYAVMLARWAGVGPANLLLPMLLLLGAALWPTLHGGFFFLALGILGWVRSGICFRGVPLRAAAAETVCTAGGAALVAAFAPATAVTWAIGIWLFFLMQSLYFFIVPAAAHSAVDPSADGGDPFETACREVRRVLDEIG